MKTSRILAITLLFAPITVRAATSTWNGAGLNDILTTPSNWVGNVAPASDLANTDLVFSGGIRTTPILSAPFSAHSIDFVSANPFVIQGAQFNIGEGGISNHDTQTMSFTAPVSFSGVGFVAIRAINGSLNFTNLVTLPSGSLSIAGGYDTSFGNIIGSSPLFKLGSGTTTWTPSLVTGFDVFVDGGTLRTGADGGADSFNSNASIEVHGLSVFEIGENLTLNGAELTRDNQATISVAAGKILTAQNGGLISITGPFLNASDSTINVLGANSTLTGNMGMSFLGGSTLNVTSGGTVSAGSSIIISGNGTVSVTGNDSSLSGTMLYLGTFETGTLTFSNDASGNFSEIRVDDSNVVGTAGVLNIQSGALVTAGDLFLAPNTAANTGTITITDAGSALNFTAGGTATIGAASGSTATLNVQNEGDFISGTGTTTVNATGTIALTNGDYFSYGNLTINGGQFTKDANSLFGIDSGRTLTVQAGGDISVVGNFALGIGITVNVTGAGSTISLNGLLAVVGGTTMNVLADADVFNTANGGFQVGSGVGNDVVTVDGAGSSLGFGSGGLSVGVNGSTSTLTFSNGSTGTFAGISVDATTTAGTSGLLRIQSGATVTGTSLNLAPNAAGNTGTITITGAGSALTLSGAATEFIGAANKGAGTLNVQNGGTFNSGTGLTTVNATGTIAIAGGTFVANGTCHAERRPAHARCDRRASISPHRGRSPCRPAAMRSSPATTPTRPASSIAGDGRGLDTLDDRHAFDERRQHARRFGGRQRFERRGANQYRHAGRQRHGDGGRRGFGLQRRRAGHRAGRQRGQRHLQQRQHGDVQRPLRGFVRGRRDERHAQHSKRRERDQQRALRRAERRGEHRHDHHYRRGLRADAQRRRDRDDRRDEQQHRDSQRGERRHLHHGHRPNDGECHRRSQCEYRRHDDRARGHDRL
jgi:T5SS/PEP-CTERM-associated repeat protein